MVDTFYSIIDKMDIWYWLVIFVMLFFAVIILYCFYMARSTKELEILEYEIEENQRERERYEKMREDFREY